MSKSAEKTGPDLKVVSSPSYHHLTDAGNAERLVDLYGKDLLYVHELGWLVWNGNYWERDPGDLKVIGLAKQVARSILGEAQKNDEDGLRKNLTRHAMKSENVRRVEGMIKLAMSSCAAKIEDFDKDPMVLNCPNGTVDLKTGKLRDSNRADRITKCTSVDYDIAAECPRWIAFLEEILPDLEVRHFIWKAVGYSSTAYVHEDALFLLWGSGQNGKTVFIETLKYVLGDFAQSAAPGLLIQSRQQEHPTQIADLKGARFVSSMETGEGRRFAEETVKQLTGSDSLKARFMRKDYFDFEPTHKLWLGTNYKPIIRGQDYGIWRRMRLIPFTVRIPDEQKDPELREKLKKEAPGILNWIVTGCLAWQAEGLKPPDAIVAATAEYRQDSDIIGDFVEECILVDPLADTSAKDLYDKFKKWSEERGEKPPTQTALGRNLSDRGYQKKRGTGGRNIWIAVKIKE